MSNGLFIGDKDPIEIRVGSRKATSVFLGDKKVWSNVPEGAILHLNAKGLTTEGIKQANGIPDLSGNGNNATGIDNISIVNDDDLGECFDFSNGCIDGNLTFYKTLTLSYFYKRTGTSTNYARIFLSNQKEYGYFQPSINSNGVMTGDVYNNTNWLIARLQGGTLQSNEYHCYTWVLNHENRILELYIDGNLYGNARLSTTPSNVESLTSYRIGRLRAQYFSVCRMSEIYLYPRALTAHEVKKLYLASRR